MNVIANPKEHGVAELVLLKLIAFRHELQARASGGYFG